MPHAEFPTAFVARLAGFFPFLRERGVSLGIGAEIDLGRALIHVGVTNPSVFRDACYATLAKSPVDLAILNASFEAYWWSLPVRDHAEHPQDSAVVPRSPAPDGMPVVQTSQRQPPMSMDRAGIVRIGVYSPDAPPGGHGLTRVSPPRLTAFRTGARRFRRLAATLPGRRFAPSGSGRIDFPATARRSVTRGGEWWDLRRRARRPLRTELVILWDVSGSMREHDATLFALAYALQRVCLRARVFAFSTDLEELTRRLRGLAYPRAADAVARSLGGAGGGTRIGRCLEDFRRRYGSLVRPQTAVLVLSDGWDLGDTPVIGRELGRLRRRAHLLAWVNPYARKPSFQPATAGMREALRHLHILLAPEDFASREPFRAVNRASFADQA